MVAEGRLRMLEYETHITIEASADRVWAVLTDTHAWPQWDPFCERIEGKPKLGNKIKAYTTLSPGRAFPVKVTVLDAPRTMVWSGGMPLGLFKGERTYSLRPEGDQTHFSMREVFSGPMLGLIRRSIPDMSKAFEAFAIGLKERSETGD